jgi:hypothetical protein
VGDLQSELVCSNSIDDNIHTKSLSILIDQRIFPSTPRHTQDPTPSHNKAFEDH